jgi:hypothetical protein
MMNVVLEEGKHTNAYQTWHDIFHYDINLLGVTKPSVYPKNERGWLLLIKDALGVRLIEAEKLAKKGFVLKDGTKAAMEKRAATPLVVDDVLGISAKAASSGGGGGANGNRDRDRSSKDSRAQVGKDKTVPNPPAKKQKQSGGGTEPAEADPPKTGGKCSGCPKKDHPNCNGTQMPFFKTEDGGKAKAIGMSHLLESYDVDGKVLSQATRQKLADARTKALGQSSYTVKPDSEIKPFKKKTEKPEFKQQKPAPAKKPFKKAAGEQNFLLASRRLCENILVILK